MHTEVNTVIIGSGLTGLVLGHKLKQKGTDFKILEKNEKPGGVIDTGQRDGFLFEKGPNTGVVKYGEVATLFEELAPLCEMEVPDAAAKKRYIWKGKKWHKLPSGLVGGITTNLFSWKDKFRILGEPFRKPGNDPHETLDHMVRRRMGESFLNYAVDPFILGVYAGDPSMIVPKYALPKLYDLEQDYGSFIGGALKKRKEEKTEMEKKASKDVFSVKGGLHNLIKALHQSIGDEKFQFNLNNITVKPLENGYQVICQHGGEDYTVNCKRVVSTGGSYELPGVFPFIKREDQEQMDNLTYAKVLQVAMGFKNWEGIPLDGFGGLVPHIENRQILGALFMSSFLENRAPEKGALLSVFMGGIRREELYGKKDTEIREILSKEIPAMFQLNSFHPDMIEIMRYEHAIPQYGAESKNRFETIERVEKNYPGIIIAGNLRDGIGMADRIKQAWDIAETISNQEGKDSH